MSPVYDQIKGAFAFLEAPFGVHPNDHRRALEYGDAAVAAGLSWADVVGDVRAYCATQHWDEATTQKQVDRATKILRKRFD
jgi:hypothetical protein